MIDRFRNHHVLVIGWGEMGEVDAFQIPGLKCYFPSADHCPHHFEVLRRGEYVVRVYFLRTSRKRGLN